jgi:hypothetical protein
MPTSEHFIRRRVDPRHINDVRGYHLAQIEQMVEPVDQGAEVGLCVLVVLQHLSLEVAQHGVDPLQLEQIPRFECPYYPGRWDSRRSVRRGVQPALAAADSGPHGHHCPCGGGNPTSKDRRAPIKAWVCGGGINFATPTIQYGSCDGVSSAS